MKITHTDKYRWLEEGSKRTRDWVRAQEKPTNKYLAGVNKRGNLHKRFGQLMNVETENRPIQRGKLIFFRLRKVGEDQMSLYVKSGLRGKPQLLIKPQKLDLGVIHDWHVSKDAKYIAIGFSKASNDRVVIKIFDVKRKRFIDDTITSERYPHFLTWNPDSSGFWYVRGEDSQAVGKEEKYYKKVYYHELNQPVDGDKLVFGANLAKDDWPMFGISHDGRYQIVNVSHRRELTTVYFRDTHNNASFINITGNIKARSFADAETDYIYMVTDDKAPNRKILRRKITQSSLGKWEVFVPESKFKLESWFLLKEKLLLEYTENVSSKIYLFDLKSKKTKESELPGIGSIDGYSTAYDNSSLFFSFSSLNIPPSIYELNLKTGGQKLYWRSKVKIHGRLELNQEWAKSKDGTRIPMFILKTKGKKGASPTLVNAYGGFDTSELPAFRSSVIPFVEDGGIFVVANVRGGGEFGKKWYEAAIQKKQHKRFEDLAAVLKYLVAKKYTSSDKLAVWGGSNGGLLMSVMALQYPELFKAALISVPVTDMLRFHLFHGGRWWMHDYGDPDDKSMRKYLLSYSPYHNVGTKNYPSMLFLTAEQDDRVHPMHTFKFFAKLKENKNQKNPLLLRIDRGAGHSGSGKIQATIEKFSDMFAFLYKEIGM